MADTFWEEPYAEPPARLILTDGLVRLQPSGESCSAEAFVAGELNDEVLVTFGLMTVAELRAAIQEPGLASAASKAASVDRTGAAPACACGTGCETSDQHGSIRSLVRVQNWTAPIEHDAEVGSCTVCGQVWTFESAGDSHYSYSYQVQAFTGRAG